MKASKCKRSGCHGNEEVVLSIVATPVAKSMARPIARPMARPMAKPMATPMATPMAKPMAKPMATDKAQRGIRGRHSTMSWWHHCVFLLVVQALLHHSTSQASTAAASQDGSSSTMSPSSLIVSNSSDVSQSQRHRSKRSVVHLYHMLTCTTNCNPLSYKGYGCYCGFLGQGAVVDGIDQCCKEHDWCYEKANFCSGLEWYLAPFNWRCNAGKPYCVRPARGILLTPRTCGHQLCECDRAFAECLRHQPCPKKKAMCHSSPWRLAQNIFMSIISGSGLTSGNDVDY